MEETEKKEPHKRIEIATAESSNQPITKDKIEEPLEQKNEEQLKLLVEMVTKQFQLVEQTKTLVEERLSYDTAKEKVIDKINEELKTYKDNFFLQLQKPIFVELIMLYDSLERTLNSLEATEDLSKEQITEWLQVLKDELLEILYRRDITPFNEHPEVLDYKLHKAVKTVSTSEESENNKVDKIVKAGFRWNDKIIRPEEVIIKKHVKSKA